MSIDQDRTVCKTIEKIALDFGEDYDLSFSNGGDQNNNTIPERSICVLSSKFIMKISFELFQVDSQNFLMRNC